MDGNARRLLNLAAATEVLSARKRPLSLRTAASARRRRYPKRCSIAGAMMLTIPSTRLPKNHMPNRENHITNRLPNFVWTLKWPYPTVDATVNRYSAAGRPSQLDAYSAVVGVSSAHVALAGQAGRSHVPMDCSMVIVRSIAARTTAGSAAPSRAALVSATAASSTPRAASRPACTSAAPCCSSAHSLPMPRLLSTAAPAANATTKTSVCASTAAHADPGVTSARACRYAGRVLTPCRNLRSAPATARYPATHRPTRQLTGGSRISSPPQSTHTAPSASPHTSRKAAITTSEPYIQA